MMFPLVLDLVNFNEINGTQDHHTGTAFPPKVERALATNLRMADTLRRQQSGDKVPRRASIVAESSKLLGCTRRGVRVCAKRQRVGFLQMTCTGRVRASSMLRAALRVF